MTNDDDILHETMIAGAIATGVEMAKRGRGIAARRVFEYVAELIEERSPEQVARMEREKGFV